MRRIDRRLGRELGLTGQYSDTLYESILLSSRLTTLNYGSNSKSFKGLWAVIEQQRIIPRDRLSRLGNNAVNDVVLSNDIRQLNENINNVAHAVNTDGNPR